MTDDRSCLFKSSHANFEIELVIASQYYIYKTYYCLFNIELIILSTVSIDCFGRPAKMRWALKQQHNFKYIDNTRI